MPLVDLQRRIQESGRIRIGQQVPSGNGRSRPEKLTTFRLTSSDRTRIEQIAERYGGEVKPWKAPAGDQWEVITTTDSLDVLVPPSDLAFSVWYELWNAGGCVRRCDGAMETLTEQACLCDPENRECQPHTRLSVLLRDVVGLGVWRIDSTGYYAAVELEGAVQIIQAAAGRGALLPARLRLEQRTVKRGGQTRRFAVPVLDVEISPAQLLGGEATPLQLADTPAPLTPVPQLPGPPAPSIAEQSQPPQPRPRRRNAAPPIPASGRMRRTNEQPEQTQPASAVEPTAAPASADQSEQSAPVQAAAGGPSEAPAPADTPCTHPVDEQLQTKSGATVCGICGERVDPTEQAGGQAAATEPDEEGQPARQPKTPDDEAYWPSRVHAVAGERGIDHDGLRLIGAALKRIPVDQVGEWSMTSLSEAEWEGLDKLMRRLPASLDVDAATLWIWPIAEAKGLADWEAIDPLVTAAYGKQPDDVTVAEWIAFGLRLHAGEYDAQPQARPRAAS